MKLQTEKQKKLFKTLLIGSIISILLGLLFTAILSKSNKDLITGSITNFMSQIKMGKLNYQNAFLSSIIENLLKEILLFFLGMSIIGIPITLFLFLTHAFTLGFSFSSIFYVYKWKGLLLGSIYVLPLIINLALLLILSYYSLLFSKHLFYLLFLKKDISFRRLMRRYIKVFGISCIFFIISSVVEVFVIPQLLLLFI